MLIGDEHNDGNGGHEDDNDGNGGHVDDNDDNGGHEDDNDDNVGHMDMDDEGQSDGEANEFEAMLKDLARAPDEAEGEGGQDKAFEILLEESKHPLYPGNKHVGRFALVVKLLHHKSYYRINNTAFDAWLKIFAEALPDGNTLPTSYREGIGRAHV